ncbi:MAG TPA: DUF192 domain-containing protein [Acidimicrobiales bacterium]|nr:DUF192 domain-containing protein [Acidimicrobiales bacterium]
MREGEVLAALEVADTFATRSKGLLGREGIEGAMLIKPAKSVHTVGMRFPIDVAFCDRNMTVLATVHMRRFRISLPRMRSRCVVEAEAGAFERWGLRPGDRLEIKGGE